MTVKTSFHSAVLLALVLLFVQCQPVPKPFAATGKGDFSAIQLGPRAGMLVLRIAGDIGVDHGTALSAALAQSLRRREVTASTTTGHRRSHILAGRATLISPEALQLTWRLTNAAGGETLSLTQNEVIAPDAWRRGEGKLLRRLAGNAAEAIDRRLRRGERSQGRRIALAPVTMGPLDGIPGRGGGPLAEAMRAALAEVGVPLSDHPGDDGFILLGSMHLSPVAGGQRIEMTWHLIRPNGQQFGKVSQANEVPNTQLGGDWRFLAKAIAQAGAPGIRDLLSHDPG